MAYRYRPELPKAAQTGDTLLVVRESLPPCGLVLPFGPITCFMLLYPHTRLNGLTCFCVPDDFEARSGDELNLAKGDRVELMELDDGFGDGWYLGKSLASGVTGLFPGGNMLQLVSILRSA
jgi:hypothetical protein